MCVCVCVLTVEMDPLMPALSILDTSVPKDRQQCVLGLSKEAKEFMKAHGQRQTVDSRLKDPEKAYKEGEKILSYPLVPLSLSTPASLSVYCL